MLVGWAEELRMMSRDFRDFRDFWEASRGVPVKALWQIA